jgi:hypothetical protein
MQAESGPGGPRHGRDLDALIADTHLRMADRRRQVDFSQTISSARRHAPPIVDFAEHVLSNHKSLFQGGRLAFLGGACTLPYLAARKLAASHGVGRQDIILLDIPEKTLASASPGQVADYMRGRGLLSGDIRPVTFIDNGMKGTVCKSLMRILAEEGGPKAMPYLMYSAVEDVDGYNKSIPQEGRQAVLEAAHFLEHCARSKAIGPLEEGPAGVRPRYARPRAGQALSAEFVQDDCKTSHWLDPKMAWFITQIVMTEASRRMG